MRVVVDTLVATQDALVCGSVIHYQEGGPVRFLQIEVPIHLFDWDILASIQKRLNEVLDTEPLDDPLF